MSKLQSITRSDGTRVYTICLPKDLVESLDWCKSDRINIRVLNEELLLHNDKDTD